MEIMAYKGVKNLWRNQAKSLHGTVTLCGCVCVCVYVCVFGRENDQAILMEHLILSLILWVFVLMALRKMRNIFKF